MTLAGNPSDTSLASAAWLSSFGLDGTCLTWVASDRQNAHSGTYGAANHENEANSLGRFTWKGKTDSGEAEYRKCHQQQDADERSIVVPQH
jgi:hypothetical protein